MGEVDESHIIRTIEYWDIERKRYPQYDHCAVIVAENITTRFFNVINLFNSSIPLIAIQMDAYELNGEVLTTFTKVLDEVTLGMVEEDEPVQEIRDRQYWEEKSTKETVAIVDDVLSIINSVRDGHELKYNKFYIGLVSDGKVDNFIKFRPRKKITWVHVRSPQSEKLSSLFNDYQMDVEYVKDEYRFSLRADELTENSLFLKELCTLLIN